MSKGLSIPNGRSVKARGRDLENHVVKVLTGLGIAAERNGSRFGAADRGDVAVPELAAIVQCKNTRNQSMLTTLDAAWLQAVEAGAVRWWTVHRYRRGNDFGPHSRNAWCFEESFALELLAIYHQWRQGTLVAAQPVTADD